MAAGIVYHTITTAPGVTFSLACWVPNTATPDVGAIAASTLIDITGAPIGFQAPGQALMAASQPVVFAIDQSPMATVQRSAAVTSGASSSRILSAATTNATSVKASAGNLFELDAFNDAAYDIFLKLYNKATAPTVGTDTPIWTIQIKAGTGYSRSFPKGKFFSIGIAYAITRAKADSDTTVVAVGDAHGSIDWM